MKSHFIESNNRRPFRVARVDYAYRAVSKNHFSTVGITIDVLAYYAQLPWINFNADFADNSREYPQRIFGVNGLKKKTTRALLRMKIFIPRDLIIPSTWPSLVWQF